MKKIIYSSAVKMIAVLLFVACVALGVLTVADGVITFLNEEKEIYSFERDFSKSWFLSYLLDQPESAMFSAYRATFPQFDKEGRQIKWDADAISEKKDELEANIKEAFRDFYDSDKVNFFVSWNGQVIKNCGASSPEELIAGEYFNYLKWEGSGACERLTSKERDGILYFLPEELEEFGEGSTVVIACSIKEEVVEEYGEIWARQKTIVMNTVGKTLVCAIAALLLLMYLLAVCGKNKDGEYKNMWLDNVCLEIHLAASAIVGIGAVALCIYVIEEYAAGMFPEDLIRVTLGMATALASLMILTSLLSVVRNIKTHRFVESSLVFRILRGVLRLLLRTVKWIRRGIRAFGAAMFRLLSKRVGVISTVALLVYTGVIGILGVGMALAFSPVGVLGCPVTAFLIFLLVCLLLAYRMRDLEEIKKGVREVRSGNVTYKIPLLKSGDLKALAEDVNGIAKGLDESVSAKVKAERLKTELITNVSHDLKTPITSIISYTELLSKTEGLPEEAKDYVSVIAQKSDRLKRLTQDLFDISKAQSGNEKVVLERLDVALLIEQAVGELDREIQSSALTFCVETSKELSIVADGRKMSRVLSNLIGNVLKYGMKGTRVFINAFEKDGEVHIVLKNISAYPLTFDAEEITARFVRGDESRTEEGNGLGLAIAKSYTELCGGSFEIAVDGDMFKAILKFQKYN